MLKKHGALLGFAAGLSLTVLTQAAQVPIAVTGYTQQFTIPTSGSTTGVTATYDGGTGRNGYTFYQVGEDASAPTTGLPLGTQFISAADATTSYKLAGPSTPDAILVNSANSGTFTLSTPSAYSTLSVLASTGSGSQTIAYTINYADSSTQTGTFSAPDWFNNTPVAIGAGGRQDLAGNYDHVGSPGGNPNLYQEDLGTLAKPNVAISSIAFSASSGGGNTGIWAISGTASTPEPASLSALGLCSLGLLARRRKA